MYYSVHFSFFTFLSVSHRISGETVLVSHIPRFSVFSPYPKSYSFYVSFPMLFSFLDIINILQCVYLIFHVFECILPYSRSYIVCFSFTMIFSFLAIIQDLHCLFLIFFFFFWFSPNSGSYSVHFSFFTFLSVSRHILGQTVFVSHFPHVSVFSPH